MKKTKARLTFDEWWEANDMDENPFADRTECEVAFNASKESKDDA